jgi:hypothetical protein
MTYEEMHEQIKQAILSYRRETKKYVMRVETDWMEYPTVSSGRGELHRLTITTMDGKAP